MRRDPPLDLPHLYNLRKMSKLYKLLIKGFIVLVVLVILAAEYFTLLQFGSLRLPLSVVTMLVPFLIGLRRMEYGILLLVFFTPIISLFYYSLNVRYSSLLAAVFLSVFLAWLVKILWDRKSEFVR